MISEPETADTGALDLKESDDIRVFAGVEVESLEDTCSAYGEDVREGADVLSLLFEKDLLRRGR